MRFVGKGRMRAKITCQLGSGSIAALLSSHSVYMPLYEPPLLKVSLLFDFQHLQGNTAWVNLRERVGDPMARFASGLQHYVTPLTHTMAGI